VFVQNLTKILPKFIFIVCTYQIKLVEILR